MFEMAKEFAQVDLTAIGELLRKKRKEMRKRMEDFADGEISTATISNIERGLPIVNHNKIHYYAEKLGIKLDDFPTFYKQNSKTEEKFDSILVSIQSSIDLGDSEEGLERLKKFVIPDSSPYYVFKLYLTGRYYLIKRKLNKSQGYFSDVLRLIEKFPSLARTNLKSICCYDLARAFYYKNDLQNALSYVQNGIDSFNPDGDKTKRYIIHSLKISKAIYLEKLDRLDEALQTINDLWEDIDKIKSIYVLLNMYEVKSSILKKQKRGSEAIQIAYEGIELARVNRAYERSFDLWTTLSSIYLQRNDLQEAENCIRTALSLKKKINDEYLFVNTYTHLGLLYIKKEQWDEAFKALQEAVRLGEKTNDALKYVYALIVLGDWYQLRKQYSEAVQTYQKAHELTLKHNFIKQRHMVLLELSKCWKELDEGEFNKSLENLFESELQLTQDRIL